MVDIVVNNEDFERKLIFTNTSNATNGRIHEEIIHHSKERSADDQEFLFSVNQMRNKFKTLVAECKHVALTVHSASGIQRIEDKYGKLFNDLYPIVKQRDSCDATQVCESSDFSKRLQMQKDTENQDERSPPIASPSSHLTADNVEGTIAQTRGKRIFVPQKLQINGER